MRNSPMKSDELFSPHLRIPVATFALLCAARPERFAQSRQNFDEEPAGFVFAHQPMMHIRR